MNVLRLVDKAAIHVLNLCLDMEMNMKIRLLFAFVSITTFASGASAQFQPNNQNRTANSTPQTLPQNQRPNTNILSPDAQKCVYARGNNTVEKAGSVVKSIKNAAVGVVYCDLRYPQKAQ
jgi:hypothetical protein